MAIRRRCARCGFSYLPGEAASRLAHGRYHRAYNEGLLVGQHGWTWSQPLSGSPTATLRVVRVTWQDSPRLQARIARVAALAAAAAGFDRLPWRSGAETEAARAYLALADRRAIGLAIFRWRYIHRRATITGPAWTPPGGGAERWSLDLAWVAAAWQQQGLAQQLIDVALADLGVTGAEIAYLRPFTPAGARLARRLAGGDELWLG
jgi:hypothetical protein